MTNYLLLPILMMTNSVLLPILVMINYVLLPILVMTNYGLKDRDSIALPHKSIEHRCGGGLLPSAMQHG